MRLQIIKFLTLTILFCPSCKSKAITVNEQANANSEKNIPDTAEIRSVANNNKYDLAHPQEKWELLAELFEISSNIWVDKDHLLVIEDIHPNLCPINLGESNAVIEKTIPFKEKAPGEKFDVEDVTIVNSE